MTNSQVGLPEVRLNNESVFHLFVIQVDKRQELLKHLLTNGIQAGVHYPIPVHLQPAYKDRISIASDMSVTESLTGRILSLPMYPELSMQDAEKITNTIKSFFE